MPGGVTPVDRVAQCIQVGVDAGLFGAQRIRAVEAHQAWVVGTITVAQQVPAKRLFTGFAVERQQAAHAIVIGPFAVGTIVCVAGALRIAFADDAARQVAEQQLRGVGIGGVVLHPQRLDAGIQVVGQHIVLRGAVQLLT